jgi:hypothetical protein
MDNYFSDSDNHEEQEEEEDFESSTDFDEEERNLINEKSKNIEVKDEIKSSIIKRHRLREKTQDPKALTLDEFNEKFKKPERKKWVSKRLVRKKHGDSPPDNRCFPVRKYKTKLPPPTRSNFKRKNTKPDVNVKSEDVFPTLN